MSGTLPLAQVKNVLILRTDHLGDLLLSTPLIRSLRSALPGRRFTLVASPANSEALAGWDALDEIRLFDPHWSWQKKMNFVRELRQTSWDLCMVLSPRTPAYLLGWLSGAPLRAGIVYSRRILPLLMSPFWLTHPAVLSVDEQLAAHQTVPHEVQQLARLTEVLGIAPTVPGPLELPLDPAAVNWASEWLKQQELPPSQMPEPANPILVGIHGAGKWLNQDWTAADFLSLARSVADMTNTTRVLLTFGPGDFALQMAVETELAANPDKRLLLPGRLSLSHWAALFAACNIVISPDTGSLHLAVALKRPVVAMYESDTFQHCAAQWAPWQVPSGIVRRGHPAVTLPLILAEMTRLLESEPITD